jgi:hypothetical protein
MSERTSPLPEISEGSPVIIRLSIIVGVLLVLLFIVASIKTLKYLF